jgi:chemotaxis protein methyltransferase CheR
MKKEEFSVLRDVVYEKAGIYFSDNKAYLLENRLKNRLNELNLSTFEDYYYYLRYGDKASEELNNLYDAVTTNETSFFRNPPQLEMLRSILRSEHLNGNKRSEMLRVWSAGCSTGEEPYTLAIIILELMETLREARPFTVFGTDISRKALLSAERAIFNGYAMRNVEGPIKEKYFVKAKNSYAIKESLKKCVKFDFLNLNDVDAYRKFGHMDIIFCRNVLIYFDASMKKKVVDRLHEALRPGGHLFLGHSESLYPVWKIFKPIVGPGAILYQKGEE